MRPDIRATAPIYNSRARPPVGQHDQQIGNADVAVSVNVAQALRRAWAPLGKDNEHCQRRGLDAHWAIYEARILRPACCGCEPVAVDELAREHGVRSAEVYSMLNTVKRKIRNTLESVVMETHEDPEDLSAELAELRRVLSSPIV